MSEHSVLRPLNVVARRSVRQFGARPAKGPQREASAPYREFGTDWMNLAELTLEDGYFVDLRATSKKSLFQEVAHRLETMTGLDSRELCAALIERERLGSTGMGRGVAIPHCRIEGVEKIFGCFVRTSQPIDFEAVDGEPADLFYILVAPESAGSDHLKALARVSRVLRDGEVCQKLRGAKDANALRAVLSAPEHSKAA